MRTSRSVLAAVLVVTLSSFGIAGLASPAYAVDVVVTAGSLAELQSQLDASTGTDTTVQLTSSPVDSSVIVSVPISAKLDLAGQNIGLQGIVLGTGVDFTILDSVGGGSLTAGTYQVPGIRTAGATFRLEGGTIHATTAGNAAAIGGADGESGGTIIVTGGVIDAEATGLGAGVGGGRGGASGSITISAGTVTSVGTNGAAIGSGDGAGDATGSITISGGTVDASLGSIGPRGAAIGGGQNSSGGTILISGGTVTADSSSGGGSAGVGSGYYSSRGSADAGANVTISGGHVTATGDQAGAGIGSGIWAPRATIAISGTSVVDATGGLYGAAIGGGNESTANITISGGTVTATGGASFGGHDASAAAIGSGSQADEGGALITISGGTVTATASGGPTDRGAAIGGGSESPSGIIVISSGTVVATGSATGAGIGSGGSGDVESITISGGTVTASSLYTAAGIGGGQGRTGGTITISGGTVYALGSPEGAGIGGGTSGGVNGNITISGGTVYAHHQGTGAAIGGSEGGHGANLSIGAGASVTAISDAGATLLSVIGPGYSTSPRDFGIFSVAGTLTIDAGAYLAYPATGWGSATVEAGGVITGAGSVNSGGEIANHGSISTASVSAWVTDHNYTVHFDSNGTFSIPSAADDVTVYAASFNDGLQSIPTLASSDSNWLFAGWSTTPDGPADFTGATTLSGELTLYAVWAPDGLQIQQDETVIEAGESVTFTTNGAGENHSTHDPMSLGDVTARTVFTTDSPDAVVVGNVITFNKSSSPTIFNVTATIGTKTVATTIIVTAGPLVSVVVTPTTPTSITAGDTVDFTVEGFDIGGTSKGDVTNDLDVASTNADDSVYPGAVYFEKAGTRTITVTDPSDSSITDSFDVTVLAAGLSSIQPVSPPTSVTAGTTVTFVVDGFDLYGNPLGDVSSSLTFVNSGPEAASGNSITFEEVDSNRIVTISYPADPAVIDAQLHIAVVVAPLDRLDLTGSASVVNAGDTVYFSVVGFDAYGNYVGNFNATAVFASDLGTGTISGADMQLTEAGTHHVTATVGAISGEFDVVVSALGPDHLILTPSTTGPLTAGDSRSFTATTADVYGNEIADVTADTEFLSMVASDVAVGNSVTFTETGTRTVYAQWTGGSNIYGNASVTVVAAGIDRLVISPTSASLTAGGSQAFTVTGFDEFDNPLGDVSSLVTLQSTNASDTITGTSILFTVQGTHTIRAVVTADTSTYIESTVSVVHGAATWMNVHETSSGVHAGGTITLLVDANDAYGNGFDITGSVVLSSDNAGDVGSGASFAVTEAGIHRITATLGGLSDDVDVTVDPGDPDYLIVQPDPSGTIVAGTSRTFRAATYDSYDNFIAEVTGAATFSSSNATDVPGAGTDFLFTIAGTRQISASWNVDSSIAGSVNATVLGDTSDPATMTITASTTSIDQFGTVTVTISGYDQFGNPITGLEQDAVITSDMPTDVIVGNTITFPHASPHIITATLGGATTTLLIQVIPAALASTGVDAASTLTLALLLLLVGVALVAVRRRRRA